MEVPPETIARRAARFALAALAPLGISIVMTWPLAANMGGLGRTSSGDGMYAIWNVSWVARTVATAPIELFDANIFHPDRSTLAYSELNVVAGLIGLPAWLLTGDAYVTHNVALLAAFATSALCGWLLARYLTASGAAALVCGVVFAFSPYHFSHTAHIQLLFGGGIPLSLLMLHRLADAPSMWRGAALGLVLAVQALACAYYGILAGLMIGYASLLLAASRRLWRSRTYWIALACGAVLVMLGVVPFFLPFLQMRSEGFRRTIAESSVYAANLPSYLTSSAHAHAWLLEWSRQFGPWIEVLFPGFVGTVLGTAGLVLAGLFPRHTQHARALLRDRETAILYGSLGLLTVWASLGPAAGLYTALYHAVPLFSFLRAPSRFGVAVPLFLGVFAALALARVPPGARTVTGVAVAALAAAELNILPFPWDRAQRIPPAYAVLARMPRGPVAEFPFYGERPAFHLHAQYMLFSTAHWQPLVNGYSDHIPAAFRTDAVVLSSFPSTDSFAVLRRRRARYIGVHWDMFWPRQEEIRSRLRPFERHLRPIASDDTMTIYEIVSFP